MTKLASTTIGYGPTRTVRLPLDIIAELEALKVHPRETLGDVIVRLLVERDDPPDASS